MNRDEIQNEILRFYQKYAKTHSMIEFSNCSSLINDLGVSEMDLENGIYDLKSKKFLDVSLCYGMKAYEGMSRITSCGMDHLDSLEEPKEKSNGSIINVLHNYGTISDSTIGMGLNVSIQISDSFNKIRSLPLSEDDLKIVGEMEQEAYSEHPSLDKILEIGKNLWSTYGDSIKEAGRDILVALIRGQIGL